MFYSSHSVRDLRNQWREETLILDEELHVLICSLANAVAEEQLELYIQKSEARPRKQSEDEGEIKRNAQ